MHVDLDKVSLYYTTRYTTTYNFPRKYTIHIIM